MSPAALAAAAAIMALGAWIQGAVGFGSNLIAAPLLVHISTDFIPAPVTIASCALSLLIIRREHVHGRADARIRYAIAGLLPGTLVAGAVLAAVPEAALAYHPVSKAMNSPSFKSVAAVEAIPLGTPPGSE